MKTYNSLKKSQQGMATLLIVIVIGMLLTVTTLSIVYTSRSTQDKQVTVHAVTHAQAGVWSGVEIFRSYIESLEIDARLLIDTGAEFSFAADAGTYNITVDEGFDPNDLSVKLKATINYIDQFAKSSSQLQFVIQLEGPDAPPPEPVVGINVYGNLDVGGDVTATDSSGVSKLTVDGDVNINSVALNDLEELVATGTVRIGSAVSLDSVWSNTDVVLTGAASVTDVYAVGNLVLEGSADINDAIANGFMHINTNQPIHSLSALGLNLNQEQTGTDTVEVCIEPSDDSICSDFNTRSNQAGALAFAARIVSVSDIDYLVAKGNVVTEGGAVFGTLQAGQQYESACYDAQLNEVDCAENLDITPTIGALYGSVTGANEQGKASVTGSLLAYGDIDLDGGSNGAYFSDVISYSSIDLKGASTLSVRANGAVNLISTLENDVVHSKSGGVTIKGVAGDVLSGGDVILPDSGDMSNATVVSGGSITCNYTGWSVGISLTYVNTLHNCATGNVAHVDSFNINDHFTEITEQVDVIDPLQPRVIDERPYVDMWLLEDRANFAFHAEIDGANIYTKVTVNNIMMHNLEITSEEYYLAQGKIGALTYDYLCMGSFSGGVCSVATESDILNTAICVTGGENGCFIPVETDSSIEWWVGDNSNPEGTVPGVYWFNGDVKLGMTALNATILATEDILTTNTLYIKSLNYSTFEEVCQNERSAEFGEFNAFDAFDGVYPINYCQQAEGGQSGELTPHLTGNVVLGAGGIVPVEVDTSGLTDAEIQALEDSKYDDYVGGDIVLEGLVSAWGTIMAGNELIAESDVTLHGFFIALGWNQEQGDYIERNNTLNGKLKVIYEDPVPETYSRYIPSASNLCAEDNEDEDACYYKTSETQEPTKEDQAVEILWARYL